MVYHDLPLGWLTLCKPASMQITLRINTSECPSKPNHSKAVNTRFPLELEKVAPRTACIVGSLFASAPAGLHDN